MRTLAATTLDHPEFRPSSHLWPDRATVHAPSSSWEIPFAKLCLGWALLIPVLFFIVRGTPSYDHAADISGDSYYGFVTGGGAGTIYTKLELVFTYSLALCLIYPYTFRVLRVAMQNKIVLALPVLALISILWSQDRGRTLIFGSSALALTLFALFLAERFTAKRQIELMIFGGWAAILASYLLIALVPSIGISHLYPTHPWNGLFSHKNHCGMIMTYLFLTAYYWQPLTKNGRLGRSAFMFLAFVLIIMSQSRTAWLLFGCAAALIVGMRYFKRFRNVERVAILMCTVAITVTLAIFVVANAAKISVLLGKDATLTGRTGIWAGIIPSAMKRPFFGFGYDAFWLGFEGESANFMYSTDHIGLANAENAVLQMWLELGLVGVALMLWMLYKSCKNAIACLKYDSSSPYIQWYVVIVFLTLLALVDGDKIMAPHTIEWVLYIMAYIGLSKEARRLRTLGLA